jgi:hypothetical protein
MFGTFDAIGQPEVDFSAGARCYNHNYLRFFPIFGEIISVFLHTNFMIKF